MATAATAAITAGYAIPVPLNVAVANRPNTARDATTPTDSAKITTRKGMPTSKPRVHHRTGSKPMRKAKPPRSRLNASNAAAWFGLTDARARPAALRLVSPLSPKTNAMP